MRKLLAMLLLVPAVAFCWTPTRTIEGVIGFGPGSGNDILFRVLSAEVEKNTGAKFNTLNRGGAGGVIGTEELSKRPADGHSATVVSVPGLVAMDKVQVPDTNSRTYTTDSFVYPTHLASTPMAVVANPKDTVTDATKLVQVLKTEKVSVAASGGARLGYELLKARLNFKEGVDGVVRLDHKGPIDALVDVASGNVRFAVVPVAVAMPMYKAGKLSLVALTSAKPIPELPNVSLINSVLPNFEIYGTWGLMLPANTPPETVQWYAREFTKAMDSPAAKQLYSENLMFQRKDLHNPEAFKAWVKAREKEYQPLVDVILKPNK